MIHTVDFLVAPTISLQVMRHYQLEMVLVIGGLSSLGEARFYRNPIRGTNESVNEIVSLRP